MLSTFEHFRSDIDRACTGVGMSKDTSISSSSERFVYYSLAFTVQVLFKLLHIVDRYYGNFLLLLLVDGMLFLYVLEYSKFTQETKA